MRPLTRSGFGVAALVAIAAACSDNVSTTATAPTAPSSPNLALTAPTCDPSVLRSLARSYAASNKDLLFTIIGDLQSLYSGKTNALTTNKAFDGLKQLAAMRRTDAQLSTATGATFNALTLGFIGCMESGISSKLPDDFSVAGALNPGWIYEVRGGTADLANGAYARGSSGQYWSAEAPDGWTPSSAQKRFLIYGYPFDLATGDTKVGSGLELRTVPKIGAGLLLSSPLLIGLCNIDPTLTTARVQHVGDVLPKKSLTCEPGETAPLQVGFSGLVHRAVQWLSPKPAYAAMFVGSIGGAVSELSPSVVIDMQNVVLKFVDGIGDGRNSRPLTDSLLKNPVRVTAKTPGGTALPAGIRITLSIAGNQSSIAFFKVGKNGASDVTVSADTDENGIAVFKDVYLTKAGGYQLIATGTWDDIPGVPFLSNSFNIQNK